MSMVFALIFSLSNLATAHVYAHIGVYIYIICVGYIYSRRLPMHRLFILQMCIDRSFVYINIWWLYDSEKTQLSTTVASRVQCSCRRESPPAAVPVVDGRCHPRRKS